MNMAMKTSLALIGTLSLAACGGSQSFEFKKAPFHVYGSAILNEDPSPIYPRDSFDLFGLGEDQSRAPAQASRAGSTESEIVDWRPEKASEGVESRGAVDSKETKVAKKAPAKAEPDVEGIRSVEHAADFIRAIYKVNKVDLGPAAGGQAIATLHETFKRRGRIYHATRPAVGDVIFFHNTFDRNGDQRNNDWYTHIGLVEGVEEDGTIHVLSYREGKVDSFVLNLEHPSVERKKGGKVWNESIRPRSGRDAAFTQYLGGELFAGFGSLLGDRTELMVVDNWSPGMVIEGL